MNQSCTEYFLHKYSPSRNEKSFTNYKFGRSGSVSGFNGTKTREWENEKSFYESKKRDSQGFQQTTWKIEGEIQGLKEVLNKVEGSNVYMQTQIGCYEKEIRKLNDKVEVERKDWARQVELLKSELERLKKGGIYKEKLEVDGYDKLKQEIFVQDMRKNALFEENLQLRTRFEEEKQNFIDKLTQKDEIIEKLQSELEKTQKVNESLKEVCRKQQFDIKILCEEAENLTKSCEKISNLNTKRKPASVTFSNSHYIHKSQKEKKVPDSALSKSVYHKKCKNPNFTSSISSNNQDFGRKNIYVGYDTNQELFLKNKVKNLETEIAEVNKDYKKLLTSTKPGSQTYLKYKKQINNIAKMLETKSKSLYKDKRRYSSLISQHSLSSDSIT